MSTLDDLDQEAAPITSAEQIVREAMHAPRGKAGGEDDLDGDSQGAPDPVVKTGRPVKPNLHDNSSEEFRACDEDDPDPFVPKV